MNAHKESSDLIGQRKLRIEKLNELKKQGIDTYPSKSNKEYNNSEITDRFDEFNGKTVTVAGRISNMRGHGKLIFMDLVDMTGKIQTYVRSDSLASEKGYFNFDNLNLLDIGDIIEVKGEVNKTERGEISVLANSVRLLTKALRPMPTELEDKEERYRRRYLDMNLHPEIRARFARRSKFWQATRDFMNKNGFIEINIPVLEHTTGGADAKPFVTHYDALNENFYLRISHELPLKRLLGAGYHKVYDVGVRFRNEGFSEEHLPEHIAMEWYWAYANFRDGMKLTQEMFKYIMQEVYGTTKFTIKGFEVDLGREWEEIDYTTIIRERFGVDIFNDDVEKMDKILKENGVDLGTDVNRNRAVDNLWKLIRKTIGGPSFLVGVPKFMSPLAKTNPENPELTERFLALIAGTEMTNAYSELNDPIDQLNRFAEQEQLREGGDDEAQMLDIDYVEMLEYGMPPACGYGMSERVFWFFENVTAKEGVPFPQLRFTIDDITRKIYGEELMKYVEKEVNEAKGIQIEIPKVSLSDLQESSRVKFEKDVVEKFPGIKTGYIILEGVSVSKSNAELTTLKEEIEKTVRSKFQSGADIKKSPNMAAFREIYKGFGVDPDSHLNSSEALLKRVVSGKGIYNINNVVDTYNATSVEFQLPMAAYDLDQIDGDIVLRFGKDGDSIKRIMEEEDTPIEAGTLVYSDNRGVVCMDLNYRDSDRTKITDATKNIIVFVDGHKDLERAQIEKILSTVAARLEKFTGGKTKALGFAE